MKLEVRRDSHVASISPLPTRITSLPASFAADLTTAAMIIAKWATAVSVSSAPLRTGPGMPSLVELQDLALSNEFSVTTLKEP